MCLTTATHRRSEQGRTRERECRCYGCLATWTHEPTALLSAYSRESSAETRDVQPVRRCEPSRRSQGSVTTEHPRGSLRPSDKTQRAATRAKQQGLPPNASSNGAQAAVRPSSKTRRTDPKQTARLRARVDRSETTRRQARGTARVNRRLRRRARARNRVPKVLKTDPTRAKAALKKLDFAAHAARCGLQKGQPVRRASGSQDDRSDATGLHRTVTAMADERDHFKYVAEQLEVKLLGNMKSKQSQIEAPSCE